MIKKFIFALLLSLNALQGYAIVGFFKETYYCKSGSATITDSIMNASNFYGSDTILELEFFANGKYTLEQRIFTTLYLKGCFQALKKYYKTHSKFSGSYKVNGDKVELKTGFGKLDKINQIFMFNSIMNDESENYGSIDFKSSLWNTKENYEFQRTRGFSDNIEYYPGTRIGIFRNYRQIDSLGNVLKSINYYTIDNNHFQYALPVWFETNLLYSGYQLYYNKEPYHSYIHPEHAFSNHLAKKQISSLVNETDRNFWNYHLYDDSAFVLKRYYYKGTLLDSTNTHYFEFIYDKPLKFKSIIDRYNNSYYTFTRENGMLKIEHFTAQNRLIESFVFENIPSI